jgi:FKBP-type peptidyl-prolyl cis-trans isomerase
MNRSFSVPVLLSLTLFALGACNKADSPDAAAAKPAAADALVSDQQRMGYGLGASVGRQFRGDGLEVDVDALARGVREGFSSDSLAMTDEEIGAAMQQLQQGHAERMKAEQEGAALRNKTEGDAFLAKNGAEEGVVTTESGLQYKIITAGDGPKPGAEDTVKVHYRGTLLDGTEFDSSYKRGEPVTFPVGGVIPGWVEALQLMPVGSKWNLYIPSDLAYGPGGAGGQIGPNAMLTFEVELLAIEDPQAKGDE